MDELMTKHKTNWEFVEPVEFKGNPSEQDIKDIKARCKELAIQVKEAVASKSDAVPPAPKNRRRGRPSTTEWDSITTGVPTWEEIKQSHKKK